MTQKQYLNDAMILHKQYLSTKHHHQVVMRKWHRDVDGYIFVDHMTAERLKVIYDRYDRCIQFAQTQLVQPHNHQEVINEIT